MSVLARDIYTVTVKRKTESGGVIVRCPFCMAEHAHERKGIVMANCLGGMYSIIEPLDNQAP